MTYAGQHGGITCGGIELGWPLVPKLPTFKPYWFKTGGQWKYAHTFRVLHIDYNGQPLCDHGIGYRGYQSGAEVVCLHCTWIAERDGIELTANGLHVVGAL